MISGAKNQQWEIRKLKFLILFVAIVSLPVVSIGDGKIQTDGMITSSGNIVVPSLGLVHSSGKERFNPVESRRFAYLEGVTHLKKHGFNYFKLKSESISENMSGDWITELDLEGIKTLPKGPMDIQKPVIECVAFLEMHSDDPNWAIVEWDIDKLKRHRDIYESLYVFPYRIVLYEGNPRPVKEIATIVFVNGFFNTSIDGIQLFPESKFDLRGRVKPDVAIYSSSIIQTAAGEHKIMGQYNGVFERKVVQSEMFGSTFTFEAGSIYIVHPIMSTKGKSRFSNKKGEISLGIECIDKKQP